MNPALDNPIDAAKREQAKVFGLLTLREWLAKWLPGRHLTELVGDFTLDGGRGFVRDEPPRTLTNADGSFFVNCGGPVVIACPPPITVSRREGHHIPWYHFERNGAFYFVLTDDARGLRFAEAG
jgi:hypothetical protein